CRFCSVSQGGQLGTRSGRIDLPQRADQVLVAERAQLLRGKGKLSGEELVEQDSQGVDVGSGADGLARHVRLLRAHAFGRSDERPELGEDCLVGEPVAYRLGNSEIDDLDLWLVVDQRNKNV